MRAVILALSLSAATLAVGCGDRAAVEADTSEESARRQARDLERTTLSPFCPGRTLYDCPSPRAAAWRSDIRRWSAEGRSDAQIRARLQERVPDFQLESEGPVAPAVIALVVGSLLLLLGWGVREHRRARRRRERREEEEERVEIPSNRDEDALDARLERELADLGDELA